jgi:hypothetical protein
MGWACRLKRSLVKSSAYLEIRGLSAAAKNTDSPFAGKHHSRLAQGAGGVFDTPGWQAFVIPILIVVGVGALATWIPSRRALAINPADS